jgi:hypothetical protein
MATHDKFNINGIDSFNDYIMDNMAKAETRQITVSGKSEPETEHIAIVNRKTNNVAQIASNQYKILQNADFFTKVSDLVMNTGCTDIQGYILETNGGDAYQARVIFNDMEIAEPGKGNNIKVGMEFSNSLDGSMSVGGRAFYLRMSCTNQMILPNLVDGCFFSRAHNARTEQKLLEAVEIKAENFMKQLLVSGAKFKNRMEDAISDTLTFEKPIQIQTLFEEIFESERHAEKMTRYIRKQPGEYKNGIYSLTRWDLYNAVTDYASHDKVTPNVFDNILVKAEAKILNNKKLEIPAIPVRA